MPTLRYFYSDLFSKIYYRPIASALAINLLNGKSKEFLATVDTGADQTSLSYDIMQALDINPKDLVEVEITSAERKFMAGGCDFIQIAFLEAPNYRRHFPNGGVPVPVHFTEGCYSYLGRELFLDLCKLTFDGPAQTVTVDL